MTEQLFHVTTKDSATRKNLNTQKQIPRLNLSFWITQKSKGLSIFYRKRFIKETSAVQKLWDFGFKVSNAPRLLMVYPWNVVDAVVGKQYL